MFELTPQQQARLDAIKQSIVANRTALTTANTELTATKTGLAQVLIDARAGLVSPPVAGEQWSAATRYITGDTCTHNGKTWVAQRYTRNDEPGAETGLIVHWVEQVASAYPDWSSITDGTVIEVDTIVTYGGATWKCTNLHMKSHV